MNEKLLFIFVMVQGMVVEGKNNDEPMIEIFDLTRPTTWKDLAQYYSAVKGNWKVCLNCGVPSLGTSIHMEQGSITSSVKPAVIPPEYLLTRLVVIDTTYLPDRPEDLVLTLNMALQWRSLRRDPTEPTLLLFKFDWVDTDVYMQKCVCKIPEMFGQHGGLSYELAEWIANNLTHVVGVATDAPTLESAETRERKSRTVANVLGLSGVYMIENVNLRRRIPERGCMAIAMPMMILDSKYLPTRLTAVCPAQKTDQQVTIALKKVDNTLKILSRSHEINLKDVLDHKPTFLV